MGKVKLTHRKRLIEKRKQNTRRRGKEKSLWYVSRLVGRLMILVIICV